MGWVVVTGLSWRERFLPLLSPEGSARVATRLPACTRWTTSQRHGGGRAQQKLTGSSWGRGCSSDPHGHRAAAPRGAAFGNPWWSPGAGTAPRRRATSPAEGSRCKLSVSLGDRAAERSLPCVRRVVPASSCQLPAVPGRLHAHWLCFSGWLSRRQACWLVQLLAARAGGRPSVRPPLLAVPAAAVLTCVSSGMPLAFMSPGHSSQPRNVGP